MALVQSKVFTWSNFLHERNTIIACMQICYMAGKCVHSYYIVLHSGFSLPRPSSSVHVWTMVEGEALLILCGALSPYTINC